MAKNKNNNKIFIPAPICGPVCILPSPPRKDCTLSLEIYFAPPAHFNHLANCIFFVHAVWIEHLLTPNL